MTNSSGSTSQVRREIRDTLAPRIVSEPLKTKIERELRARATDSTGQAVPASYEVIIEINLNNPDGRVAALARIRGLLESILADDAAKFLGRNRDDSTHPYVFATLRADQILDLVKRDGDAASRPG